MANIKPTIEIENGTFGGGQAWRVTWSTITNADVALPVILAKPVAECHVKFSGTFDGATGTFQGGQSAADTFETINDKDGAGLSFTAAGGGFVGNSLQLLQKPVFSGGGASQDVDVVVTYVLAS